MSESTDTYVLDTSAWPTLIEDEAGADTVQRLLEEATAGEVTVLVSFMSIMEIYYITLQERNVDEARKRVELIAALPVLHVDSTETLGILAAELKAAHHLSVADAWIAALARQRGATLVHKDPEFDQVEATVPVSNLWFRGFQSVPIDLICVICGFQTAIQSSWLRVQEALLIGIPYPPFSSCNP